MKQAECAKTPRRARRAVALGLAAIGGFSLLACDGGAFNPAFVNVVTGEAGTIPNPPGHVIVALVNNTEFDERLLDFLAPQLNLTEAEVLLLRPRVRMRLRITFTDASFLTVEMVDGSRGFIEPGFEATADPDLNQNDLRNLVVNCDVASVTIEPGTSVEVFVPVELTGFELVDATGAGGQVITEFQPRQSFPPQFIDLQVDDVDEDGNVILRRNVGTRDLATPATNVLCGSVIAITMSGALSVPFLDGVSTSPSFDIDNEPQVAGIGGRFSFRTSIQ